MRSRAVAVLLLGLLIASCQPSRPVFDTLILNGKIVDGSGNPWFYGDVGIVGDKIVEVGKLSGREGKRVIDAKGKIVCPGFIDMLGQSEMALLVDPRGMSKISQGITTEITGEGESVAPLNDRTLETLRPWMEKYHKTIDWRDFEGYFRRLEQTRPALNLGSYVGAAQVREVVVGMDDRAPTEDELDQMQDLVRTAMRQGALGLSTALIYAPGTYAKTSELIALAKAASTYGGIYATHIRDEGNNVVGALFEATDISREANLPVEVWHLKVAGKQNWGRMAEVVNMIHDQRNGGIDITANIYPYPASATDLSSRIPSWVHDGGTAKLIDRLKDPATRQKVKSEILGEGPGMDNSMASTGPEGILISSVSNPELKQYEGKRLSEIARSWNKDAVDMMIDLVIADSARTGAVFFSMSEQDVRMAMAQPWVSFCTDAAERATDGPLFQGKPHPRAYGSFPRILGKYVRDAKLISVEEAIRKMTSLPATRTGLTGRGLLKAGFFADVVVYDPSTVNDKATFEDPHQYSVGIEHVFVNGLPVWEEGAFAGNYPGKVLYGPGYVR